jgi:CBS domain-containing protein
MRCKELMIQSPVFCGPMASAANVAQLMTDRNIGAVPIVSDPCEKKLIGIVTDRDLALRVDAAGLDSIKTPAGQIMTRDVITCSENDQDHTALETMKKHKLRRLPIVDSAGYLVGIISQTDLLRCMEGEKAKDRRADAPMKYCKSGLLVGLGIAAAVTFMVGFAPGRGKSRRRKLSWKPFLRLVGTAGLGLLVQVVEERYAKQAGRSFGKPVEAHRKPEAA